MCILVDFDTSVYILSQFRHKHTMFLLYFGNFFRFTNADDSIKPNPDHLDHSGQILGRGIIYVFVRIPPRQP